jgi:hypothetical protein
MPCMNRPRHGFVLDLARAAALGRTAWDDVAAVGRNGKRGPG